MDFATERNLSASDLRHAYSEHQLFSPDIGEESHVARIDLDTVRAIASIRCPDIDFHDPNVSYEEVAIHIGAIQSDSITPEEEALGKFTRRKLRSLPTWNKWQEGERKQLDHFHSLGMYGDPIPRPHKAIVLRPHWQYRVKTDGTRRSRNCCDGSPRAAPLLHGIASTYSSCVEQPIQRLFVGLSAHLGYRIYGADAQDAYAHSPPPEKPTYVAIDDAYAEWYENRFNKKLDRSFVLPVLHALQGHPESGKLWEQHINSVLTSPELGFCSTRHDRTIYSAEFDGIRVLLLRQVDDFALACPNEDLARRIYALIGSKLQLPSETKPPFKYLGLVDEFNGVSVTQTRTSVTLSCPSYIRRVLRAHGWSTPDHKNTETDTISPIPADSHAQMFKDVGPKEGTPEHARLAQQHGFSYRTLLGELLYSYVTCRPDIGYAVTTLSKFSISPASFHYTLLKGIAKYLRRTIDWGIVYTKTTPDEGLPPSKQSPLTYPQDLPAFPEPAYSLQLQCFVDAAHANDLRNRRSTTGYAFTLCGGAVSYRTKTQTITATSSTEAEFLAAVLAAKHAKYLRAIMRELGFPQTGPTPIYEDNMSAINMINAKIPTDRSRHIDIQHFAIQDWKDAQDIVMHHIPGIINPSDDLTKPLGWILHARHARRIMGHYW